MENNLEAWQLLQKIAGFVNSIGIPCKPGTIDRETFLPGVDINNGSIVYDEARLISPGDILHEAGHIAVLLEKDREKVTSPDVSGDLQPGGAEMAAIAWSWAALRHLGLSPDVVFHEKGYHGESSQIIMNFSAERYFGVSLLQWFGMTCEKKNAGQLSVAVYPEMQFWLRPS